MRTNQIFVRSFRPAHERRGNLLLAGFHENGLREELIDPERKVGGVDRAVHVALVLDERDPLAVDRHVDVLEIHADAAFDVHLELVVAVRREDVVGHDAAARSVRGAVDVIPGVLRDERRDGIGRLGDACLPVANGEPADRGRGVEIRLEQRRRQRLHVGDVVEVGALRVEREVVARIDVDAEEILYRILILVAIEALERTRARVERGAVVDHVLERLDQRQQRVAAWTRHARRRHHLRAELANHHLADVPVLDDLVDVEVVERQVARHVVRVVTGGAILRDDLVQLCNQFIAA